MPDYCEICLKPKTKRLRISGYFETPAQIKKRRTCGDDDCIQEMAAQVCRENAVLRVAKAKEAARTLERLNKAIHQFIYVKASVSD